MWQKTVASTLERHQMLRFGRRIGVAVSGGADSVFLLHSLTELGLACVVLHVNHKLRGADSDADEAFVRQVSLPVHSVALPPAPGNTEQEARRLRYAFFEECLERDLCDAVATGHTMDDQAETVLGRFLRGAGTAGLSGIRPVTAARIIRPLLGMRRVEIREILAAAGLRWQEDCTNTDTAFTRNHIRIETMPQLMTLNPALPQVLAGTADWALAEEDYWTCEIARLEPELLIADSSAVLIPVSGLARYSLAVRRRLVRRAIERVKGSLLAIDFDHTDAILQLAASADGSGRVQVPGIDAYRSFDWLRIAPPGHDNRNERNFDLPLTAPGSAASPERGWRISLKPLERELIGGARVYNNQMNALDGECCAAPVTLRNWRPGDRFTPAGKTEDEKIKSLFQKYRVPLWERRNWPVVASGDSILWTRRFGVAAAFQAGPHSTTAFEVEDGGNQFARSQRLTRRGANPTR